MTVFAVGLKKHVRRFVACVIQMLELNSLGIVTECLRIVVNVMSWSLLVFAQYVQDCFKPFQDS